MLPEQRIRAINDIFVSTPVSQEEREALSKKAEEARAMRQQWRDQEEIRDAEEEISIRETQAKEAKARKIKRRIGWTMVVIPSAVAWGALMFIAPRVGLVVLGALILVIGGNLLIRD